MTGKSRMGPKGKVTIPRRLRERYGLLEGEKVVFLAESDGVLLKRAPSVLRGRLRGMLDLAGLESEVRALRDGWTLKKKATSD